MRRVTRQRKGRRLTVISRRRPWNVDAFAAVFAAYVMQRLAEKQLNEPITEQDEVTA